jgi:hypothetical protein
MISRGKLNIKSNYSPFVFLAAILVVVIPSPLGGYGTVEMLIKFTKEIPNGSLPLRARVVIP